MSTLDIVARFAAVVDAQSGREDIGSAASQARVYRQLAKQQLEALEGDRFSGRGQQQQSAETYWQTEGSTWDLVERLYGLRAQAQTQDGEGGEDIEVTATATEFGAVQALLGRDSQLAECVEVRRWLEETAPAFQAVETRKGYLFYTRRSAAARGAGTVTEADPDAMSRQRRGLAPEDAEYAAGLVRTLYEYVRRGRAGSAIALCVESDDAWRAATLKGSLFWRDPALERGEANNVHAGGNINRALWKHACAALAADDANDAYERALYAALSGRLDEVALVCDGWDDHLWAHVNTLVEARIDRAVADAAPLYVPAQTAALAPVPSRHAPPRDLAHILDALASHDAPPLRHAAAQPFRRLQAAVIVDGFPAYLAAYAQQIGPDADLLRVVVHIALHLRGLGFALPSDAVAAVLDAYIDLLIRENRDLVAVYVACLPPGCQTEAYAQFLRTVEDPAPARMQLLALAAAHGLDVDQVAKRAAQLVLAAHAAQQLPPAAYALAEPAECLSSAEVDQIRAVEWITSSPRLYDHALVETCSLARRFLLCGRTNAATKLFNSLPSDFVQREWLSGSTDSANPLARASAAPDVVSHVHEYIHLLSLCDAYAHYSVWAEVMCKRPTSTAGSLPSARMQAQILERRESAAQTTDRAVHMFRRSLLDVDWLGAQSLCISAASPSDGAQPLRLEELSRLRGLYIPETVFRLHSILFDSRDVMPQNLKLSLDLAQLVADESLGIYHQLAKSNTAYPRGRLTAFLGLMRRSAFEILRIQQLSCPDKPPLLADSTPLSVGGAAAA